VNASLIHFSNAVERIQQNSWWFANFAPGKQGLTGFSIVQKGDSFAITEVPREPFEALLLHVRKLTMNDSPENLHKVRKALKATAKETDQRLLDVWHKYWRLTFIHPVFTYSHESTQHVMTPWRVYDCLINGDLFHTNDPEYNAIIHGDSKPGTLSQPHMFLRNFFHVAVTNLCLAAIGLNYYIENGCTIDNFQIMPGKRLEAVEFLFCRNKIDEMDMEYKRSNDVLIAQGGGDRCRWT
jgi:hypothetical protein